MDILLATNNRHKLSEFQAILKDDGIKVAGLSQMKKPLRVEENGSTFLENALIKAKAAFELFRIPTVADDSGLEVFALGNRPGVISSRFSGKDATDEKNYRKLLDMMKDIPAGKRGARFVCATVFIPSLDAAASFAEGYVEGEIIFEPRGTTGFGYDPVFYYPPLGKTFAELSSKEKNSISHRNKALEALRGKILEYKKSLKGSGKG
jgi:XTP/dITP diphosphohydrolase